MKKYVFWLVILSLGVMCGEGRYAEAGGGGLTGGATELTQIANNSELMVQVEQMSQSLANEIEQITNQITQITNQITMISDMARNTLGLPSKLIGKVTGAVSKVMGVYNQVNGLLQNLANIDDEFYQQFYSVKDALKFGSDYGWSKNFAEEYHKLSVAMEEKAEEITESLGVTAEDIIDSSELLGELAENAASAEGRNAILQAGNELLSFLGGELTKARALLAEQTKTYMDYAERERTIKDAAAEAVKKDMEQWKEPEKVDLRYEW